MEAPMDAPSIQKWLRHPNPAARMRGDVHFDRPFARSPCHSTTQCAATYRIRRK